tara:strand:- start:865 stop:1494 length:630 start_codon:yes stop_codon:yes gene_type:complete
MNTPFGYPEGDRDERRCHVPLPIVDPECAEDPCKFAYRLPNMSPFCRCGNLYMPTGEDRLAWTCVHCMPWEADSSSKTDLSFLQCLDEPDEGDFINVYDNWKYMELDDFLSNILRKANRDFKENLRDIALWKKMRGPDKLMDKNEERFLINYALGYQHFLNSYFGIPNTEEAGEKFFEFLDNYRKNPCHKNDTYFKKYQELIDIWGSRI